MLTDTLIDYVAHCIVRDVRTGNTIPDAVLDEVYRYPFIDRVRPLVELEDFGAIVKLAESGSTAAWNFAAGGLMRNIRDLPEVKKFLLDAWPRFEDFDRRYHLLFRLLDMEDLEEERRREIWAFVKSHLREFVFERVHWYGGPDQVLRAVRDRIEDPTFPLAKKWTYLVSAMASNDVNGVHALLTEHTDSTDELTREVADYLKANFEQIRSLSPDQQA